MLNKTWGLVAMLALAGCGRSMPVAGVDEADPAARTVAQSTVSRQARPAQGVDRGGLTRYAKHGRRVDGAYTWHRVNLSEQHALAAIGSGTLHLATPQGEALSVAYARHVEHPNGDWTFVGRLRHGMAHDEVVLTFGPTAVFGTIAQGAGRTPLRVMMRDGQAWMVETDPRQLARYEGGMSADGTGDTLLPGPLPAATSGTGGRWTGPRMAAAEAVSTGPAVIDLLLGYTSGYVAAMGGEDIAKTRLFHLVELANQAFANSQVPGRVRLVGLMRVDYPDATANDYTLQQLGGIASELDPQLDALRAARETHGADLVSLVRKFEMGVQGGCGIGWLLGGGLQPIVPETGMYGFSVVGDGPYVDPVGNTIWCRDDALAHEIGHNLGAHHDVATSSQSGVLEYGAFPYSFGEKTDLTSGNFYTVMSYYDFAQVAYRTFSNPRTTFCGGRACGVVDQIDNARGIEQTMPIIAAFRDTVVAEGDLPQAPEPPPPPPPANPPGTPVITLPQITVCPPPMLLDDAAGP